MTITAENVRTVEADACRFRKTKNGKWVVFGPAQLIEAGWPTAVTKRSGEVVEVDVIGTGKTFDVDGQQMVYGYLD